MRRSSRRSTKARSSRSRSNAAIRKVPLDLLALLPGKVVQAGVIDVASDTVETAEDVVKVIEAVSKFVPKSNIVATTNCGMAPMRRDIAEAKLMALGAGAKLARQRLG